MPTLAEAKDQVRDLSMKALALVEDATMSTADKKTALDKLEPDIKKWEDEVGDLTSVEVNRKRFTANVGTEDVKTIADVGRDQVAWDAVGKSLGRQFVESAGYKGIASATGREGSWSSGAVDIKGWAQHAARKTLLAEGTPGAPGTGGAVGNTVPQVIPGIVDIRFQPLMVADMFAQGVAGTNSLRYVVETAAVNAAAATPEAGYFPESALAFSTTDERLRKITTFLPVTDEMLEDWEAAMSYIDARLGLFVKIREEMLLLRGDGTGENIVGILNRVGLAGEVVAKTPTPAPLTGHTYATGSYASPSTDNDMDAIYRQITQVRVTSFLEPEAIMIDPLGWQNIQLSKDSQGRYYAAGPFMQTDTPTLWGKRVAATTAMPSQTALVGAFSQAAQVFRRGGLAIEASNSHVDFFTKGQTAIRAQERLGLCVYRPGAFGVVSGL